MSYSIIKKEKKDTNMSYSLSIKMFFQIHNKSIFVKKNKINKNR